MINPSENSFYGVGSSNHEYSFKQALAEKDKQLAAANEQIEQLLHKNAEQAERTNQLESAIAKEGKEVEQFLSECEQKTAGYAPHTPSGRLRLAVKVLREILGAQKARDVCSDPAPYIAFDPAGIAERILKEAPHA